MVKKFFLLSPSRRHERSLSLQPAHSDTGSVSDRLVCEDGGDRSSDTRIVPGRASDPGGR
jgi:hypothetical protein